MLDRTETLVQGAKFTVARTWLTGRDSQIYPREFIQHPGAVVLLPLLDNGDLVLIRNDRFTVGRRLLELPAGTLEPPEEPEACARRELQEETGYHAGKLRPLTRFFSSPGVSTECMHAFLATELTPGQTALEPTESIAVEQVSPARVRQLLREGQIEDGKTLATLLYWMTFG